MKRPWHEKNPKLVSEIREDLIKHFPNLHLHIHGEKAEIRGTFPIKSPKGRVLDRWAISIEIPPGYPKDLPIVRELENRIAWNRDNHMEPDGKACVLLPDERFRVFPEGAPFVDFLKGPVLSFFLGQSLKAIGEDWPFGQWGHGTDGIWEFYEDLLGTEDKERVLMYLLMLSKRNFKDFKKCPCGSGKRISKCHRGEIVDLRRKITPELAHKSLERLGYFKIQEGKELIDTARHLYT